MVSRCRARGYGAGEFEWLTVLRIEESFGGWRAHGRDRGRVQDGRDVGLDEVLVNDLSRKGGKVDLWVYAWLQSRPCGATWLNVREKEATSPAVGFYALLVRSGTQRGDGGGVHGLDFLPFGPPAVRDDCLVDGISWTFGTGSADVSSIIIFGLSPRGLRRDS